MANFKDPGILAAAGFPVPKSMVNEIQGLGIPGIHIKMDGGHSEKAWDPGRPQPAGSALRSWDPGGPYKNGWWI